MAVIDAHAQQASSAPGTELLRVIQDTIYFRNKRVSGEPQSDRPMHQFEIEEAAELFEAISSHVAAHPHPVADRSVEAEAAAREIAALCHSNWENGHAPPTVQQATAIILRHLTVPLQPKAETAGEAIKKELIRVLVDRIGIWEKRRKDPKETLPGMIQREVSAYYLGHQREAEAVCDLIHAVFGGRDYSWANSGKVRPIDISLAPSANVREAVERPELIEVAAEAIWRQHMNKIDPKEQTQWEDAPPLGRGITLAYAKSALTALAPFLGERREELTTTIHRISDKEPVFPCWLWHRPILGTTWQWSRFSESPREICAGALALVTHWHPDQPAALAISPTPPAPEART